MLLIKTSVLLCMLCLAGAQMSLFSNTLNVNNVARFLNMFCGDIASHLPSVCGTKASAPPCCGLFAIVDLCRPSCTGGAPPSDLYGPDNQEIRVLMYDPNVCSALRLTGQGQCQGYGWSVQCDRLRCLMNMLCFPTYNFACFYRLEEENETGENTGGTPETQGDNGGGTSSTVQDNCFELPEMADGENTGLIDDSQSQLRQCPHSPETLDCKDKQLRYRTIDGSCNNLQNPRWGKSFEPQKRLLPDQLVDGNLPRTTDSLGNPLPSPRLISSSVSTAESHLADVSNMVMAWGQFIDHDFTGTPVIKNGTSKIKCCGDIPEELKMENGGPCFPIEIPSGDPLGRDCMEFVRSLPYSFPNGTQQVPRQQINTLTSFLDGSAVYGNTQEVLDTLKGSNGTLNVTDQNMLPESPSATCKKEQAGDYCLLAGDHRVNVFVGLGALHTIFVREHNRIVEVLRALNPGWDDDTLFEETRRIVSAEFQHVTYAEWLPLVLDSATMSKYRLTEGTFEYDANLNPTVSNVFSTATFRFGHSQIKQIVKIGSQNLALQNTLMRPGHVLNHLADVTRGLVSAPTEHVDQFFVDGLTNRMFETNTTAMDGLDLVSLNIQRGRDHGLAPFNDWREFCGLSRITDFDSPELSTDLSQVYTSVDDVDVFVGLVSETHVADSLVGPTLACLLGSQFEDIKFGDRFFYETRAQEEGFTDAQLAEIKKVTLAKVICDTIPDIKEIQKDVFRIENATTNPSEACDKLPGINLEHWKESTQDNCFELPEMADGENTGLIDDSQSQLRQCPQSPETLDCKDKYKLRYRTIDGSCNNLQYPRWGKSFEPQKRLLPDQLVDGNLPRTRDVAGNPLPSPRLISTNVSTAESRLADVSNMVMAWGQFIDHDFTGTPVIKNGTKKISCCGDIAEELRVENGGPCFPIRIPSGDPLGRDCMEFARSLAYSFPNGTQQVPRQQINTLTSFLDGSAVYGNTQEVLDTLKGANGTLKVTDQNMLPESPSATCKKENAGDYCLLAGDHRVNVFVGLGALHTIFVREHNRIVEVLRALNPGWDDDTLFEETRRIVSAEFQHVTYAEWLPLVLDSATMSKYRLTEGTFEYDANLNPTVSNVFSTATFRFGHSQIKQIVKIGSQNLALQNTLMRPGHVLNHLADVTRGLVSAPTEHVDQFFVDGLTNRMFETNTTAMDGLDLVSLNIQRGRDHGLAPFNDWREFCGLSRITDFDSPELSTDLSQVYTSVDDVDVFVGLVSETHVADSLVGPTLACLLGSQFEDIKFGDRFFYETRAQEEGFTDAQLAEIKKVTLAKVICDTIPDIKEIQKDVFRIENATTNPSEACDKLPGINLEHWKESTLDNCFELPEMADGENTGLIDDSQSQLRQCPQSPETLDCKDKYKLRYRTIDGSCNNLQYPRWGKSFEPQKRLLPDQLVDGNLPRTRDVAGNPLPSPRLISTNVSTAESRLADVSNMVMAWGQFIDHDFTGTPVIKNGTKKISCCGDIAEELRVENGGPCFPIKIPSGDPLGRDCMEFVRSLAYFFPNGTQQVPRQQINTLTSFLDGSAVYGNTQEVLDTLKGANGTLKVTDQNMLPESPSATCKKEKAGDYCLLAGDHRVNVFVGLGALHTIFVREHNRIIEVLRALNPGWDDDTLFEETRRIVSAEFQHVTYAEWLPLVLDSDTMSKYRLTEGTFEYDANLNPTVSNVFSTATFRFGHSQIKQIVKIGSQNLTLQSTLMRPGHVLNHLADVTRGLISAPTEHVDQFFVDGLTNRMFETNTTAMDGLDLVSLNIQRGRDHGLPPFNDWREFCGLSRITDFGSPELSADLSQVYTSVDDVDVFVGLVSETHVAGSLVGPTLACLLGSQFEDIKFGDRFFYETRAQEEGFTDAQLAEIKKVTLAKVICDTIPDIKEIQKDVFRTENAITNPSEFCEKIPGINLEHWRESSTELTGRSVLSHTYLRA